MYCKVVSHRSVLTTSFFVHIFQVTAFLQNAAGFKKTVFFKAQPSGFFGFYWVLGFYWVFLDKQEKIGKMLQKLSNLKP